MSLLRFRFYSMVRQTQVRTKIMDFQRQFYEPRGGLRTREDLIKEEEEIKDGKHPSQMPLNYTALGNKRKTPKDLIFYTNREGGKGYSDFAHTSYPSRPYVWGPLRFVFKVSNIVTIVFLIIFCVDFDWLQYHAKSMLKDFRSEAATLSEAEEKEHEDSNCSIPNVLDETRRKKKKVGFRERRIIEYENRIRLYSTPDKIFRYFATLKIVYQDGSFEIFMTPDDFVRSLTPGILQPRNLGLDKFKIFSPNQAKTQLAKDKDTIFHWVGDEGFISFSDYLFLMTLLSTPPSEFRLAFHVYDLNGDGELDEEEFARVQELVLNQSNVGQRHRDHVTGTGSFRKTKSSVITNYFFGRDSKEKLCIEKFLQFQEELHRDILKIEFDRRDPESMPTGIISEVSFADLLLLHSNLPEKRQSKMLKRVKRKYKNMPNKKGVSFDEVNKFFAFIYHIDKIDLALHFYKLAGRPLNKELLQKVAKKVTGVEISDTTVNIAVTLFDENGDEQLSQKEFVAIMKKRMQRGLERPKDTGLMRFIDALIQCGKKQIMSFTE